MGATPCNGPDQMGPRPNLPQEAVFLSPSHSLPHAGMAGTVAVGRVRAEKGANGLLERLPGRPPIVGWRRQAGLVMFMSFPSGLGTEEEHANRCRDLLLEGAAGRSWEPARPQ